MGRVGQASILGIPILQPRMQKAKKHLMDPHRLLERSVSPPQSSRGDSELPRHAERQHAQASPLERFGVHLGTTSRHGSATRETVRHPASNPRATGRTSDAEPHAERPEEVGSPRKESDGRGIALRAIPRDSKRSFGKVDDFN